MDFLKRIFGMTDKTADAAEQAGREMEAEFIGMVDDVKAARRKLREHLGVTAPEAQAVKPLLDHKAAPAGNERTNGHGTRKRLAAK